jgi:hypothetical protein
MNSNPDKVKIIVGASMDEILATIKSKFELDDTSKLRLYLTDDRIEVGALNCF